MSLIKKTLKTTAIILVLLFLFRGFLYRHTINYTPIKERNTIPLTDKKLIAAIQLESKNKSLDLQGIAVISSSITKQQLQFTSKKASNNPNKLTQSGKAHCVGYTAMFSSIANYLIVENNLEQQIVVKHLVGKMDFLGIDLHQFFSSSFYKDHDYNIIENKKTHEGFLIDTSLDDYFYLGDKSLK